MRPDRTQFFKGTRLTGEPGPTAPPPFSRRDLIKKGMTLTCDAGGAVLLGARIREATPSLADIKKRLDAIMKGWS